MLIPIPPGDQAWDQAWVPTWVPAWGQAWDPGWVREQRYSFRFFLFDFRQWKVRQLDDLIADKPSAFGKVRIPGAFRPAGEIRALYESKGVTPEKDILPYCQGGYRSANTYLALKLLGYPNVKNYLGSWWEWGNRDDSVIVLPGESQTQS